MKNAIKKISVLGFAMLSLTISAQAQWTRNAATLQTYLTNTGDNVGIGTTNPQFKLDIQSASAASMSFKSTTGNSNIIIDRANSASTSGVNYRTNGVPFWQTGTIGTDNYVIRNINLATTSLAVNYATNNVGIGTTSPASKLHIVRGPSGAIPMSNAGLVLEGNIQTFLNLLVPSGFETGMAFGNPSNNAAAGIYYNGVGTGKLDLRTGGNVSRMTIDGAGKVGIGTLSPIGKFAVVGTDGGNTVATFGYGSAGVSIVQEWPGIYFNQYYNAGTKAMGLGYGGQMDVNPGNGTMEISLTSAAATAIDETAVFSGGPQLVLSNAGNLDVTGYIGFGSIETISDGGSSTIQSNSSIVPETDNFSIQKLGSSTKRWYEVWAVDGTINTSDARLKKDVANLNYGLNEIMKLRPVTFKWNDRSTDENKVGFIAQELQKVIPEVIKDHEYLSDETTGAITKVPSKYLGVMYSDIIPVIVKGMQEMNENLTSENLKLKEQVAEMNDCIQSLCNNSAASKTSNPEPQSANQLFQNQPNPFNQSTIIRYQLMSGDANAKIIIRDLNGNLVKQVAITQSGKGQISINANELTQGTYTYTLEVNGTSVDTKLMVLVK